MQNVILSPDEVPVLGFPGTAGGGVGKGRAGSDGGEAGMLIRLELGDAS